MQALQLIKQAPRFGWQQSGHQAIDKGAFSRMSPGGFQTYLQQNTAQIQYYNDAQDRYLKGPGHYVDLEKPDNRFVSPPLSPLSWFRTQLAFQPKDRPRWETQPLTEAQLPQGPNVYTSILTHYQGVKQCLKQLYPQSGQATPALQDQLNQHIGALAHYVGDLYMPLHTTAHYNWQLGPGQPKTIHELIETCLDLPADQPLIQAQTENLPPLSLSEQTLKPFLLDAIRSGHAKVFDIVALQQQLQANPFVNRDTQAFSSTLRSQLKPMVISQMAQAQQALAAILTLASQA